LPSQNDREKKPAGQHHHHGAEHDIRQAQISDFEGIMQIENSCFPGELAYSREQMRYLVFKANGITLVEGPEGQLRGYITMLFRRNSDMANLETIGVAPTHRGCGVGKRILRAAEEWMAARGITWFRLEVSAGNDAAISMYEKAGYHITETIPEYYIYDHNGTRTAYRMEKDIEK
jgi:ribosomal protein S18 acetylase RimI-like enzyme